VLPRMGSDGFGYEPRRALKRATSQSPLSRTRIFVVCLLALTAVFAVLAGLSWSLGDLRPGTPGLALNRIDGYGRPIGPASSGGRTLVADEGLAASQPTLQEGAFGGDDSVATFKAFAEATQTSPSIATVYLPADARWVGMDGANGSLAWLLQNGWSGTPYTLAIGVPMVPKNKLGHPVATLAKGASGAYDAYFRRLGKTLVAAGESTAYLRLGWEFDNAQLFPWGATTPTAESDFAQYFQQIVTTMRSVKGEQFKFVWNPDVEAFTSTSYDVGLAFPGSSYVDDIGIDVYDSQTWVNPSTPSTSWSEATLPDLTAAASFADQYGEPLVVAEWGVEPAGTNVGFGDDPLFMANMITWMKNPANNVAYESYFNGTGSHSLMGSTFQASFQTFTQSFG